VLGLWFSRDTTFTLDELYWFSSTPHLDLRGAIEPYNGHLVFTTRLVYAAILNIFGAGYLPFRLLTLGTVLLTAGLFFVFAQRRIGAVAALAPTLVLLFYGSDPHHAISGNGFTVLLPLALGIAALLALEREDLGGDIGACVLLCLAIATFSVGVAFVAGAAALILLGGDRWRRAWVFLVPALLFGAWYLWSRSQGAGTGGGGVSLSNLLLVPNWMLNSLAAVGTSLLGLNYDYGDPASNWGPLVAAAALAALAWRLWRGNIPKWLWALMAVPATLWVIEAARGVYPPFRVPQSSRYIFPGTIAVLLVAVEAARGRRLGRGGVLVLYAVAAISLATNIALLRDYSGQFRFAAADLRSELSAVDISDGRFGPRIQRKLVGATLQFTAQGNVATGYIQAVREFGHPGFSLSQLREQAEPIRLGVDQVLADNLGLRLRPTSAPAKPCRRVSGASGQGTSFRVPAGGAVLRTTGAPAALLLRRFATAFTVRVGQLQRRSPMALSIPSDSAPDPWYASTSAPAVVVCAPPG
jgi:hypothetical protein